MKYQNHLCDEAPAPRQDQNNRRGKKKSVYKHVPHRFQIIHQKKAKKSKQDHLRMNNSTGSNNHLREALKNYLADFVR